MEVLSWLLFVAVTCLATLVPLLFKRFCSRRRLNRPPGPKRWPVFGNLHLISYLLPHQSIHELSRKYGPIMQLQFGSYPVVVASSPEMARQFLKIHDLNFVSRPETSVGRYISFDNGDIVWSPYGPYWRHVRKICSVELFSAKRLDSFEYIRIEELHALLFNLYASCGKPVTLRDHLSTYTLNNLTRLVFGKKYLGGFESKGFKKMVAEWLLLTGVINIGDFIPWINFLDLQGYLKRMKALRKEMDSFFEQVIDEHIARRHDDDQLTEFMPKDMLELLLKLADDPNPELKLSQNNVKGITWDLLVGGTDTSATTAEWAMSELLKQQDVFKQATEELDRVIGRNRWVTEEDIPNLPCIKSIVHETMRMHPVAPLLVPHLAREDCEIHGYDLVRGTRVLINAWSIGRDPTLWDAPNEFRPERFIGRDIDAKGQHFELLPFGSGRRMCPGLSLGLKFIETGLANLIHGFTWKLPNQMEPQDLNMEEVFGIVVQKKVPLIVVAEPRLPVDLYSV